MGYFGKNELCLVNGTGCSLKKVGKGRVGEEALKVGIGMTGELSLNWLDSISAPDLIFLHRRQQPVCINYLSQDV